MKSIAGLACAAVASGAAGQAIEYDHRFLESVHVLPGGQFVSRAMHLTDDGAFFGFSRDGYGGQYQSYLYSPHARVPVNLPDGFTPYRRLTNGGVLGWSTFTSPSLYIDGEIRNRLAVSYIVDVNANDQILGVASRYNYETDRSTQGAVLLEHGRTIEIPLLGDDIHVDVSSISNSGWIAGYTYDSSGMPWRYLDGEPTLLDDPSFSFARNIHITDNGDLYFASDRDGVDGNGIYRWNSGGDVDLVVGMRTPTDSVQFIGVSDDGWLYYRPSREGELRVITPDGHDYEAILPTDFTRPSFEDIGLGGRLLILDEDGNTATLAIFTPASIPAPSALIIFGTGLLSPRRRR